MTPLVLYAVAFAGLAALMGAMLAVPHVTFLARFGISVATPWLAFAVWQAARPPIGWPESARPPQGAALVSGVVRAPSTGDPGEIDLWLQPPGADRPRAYRLPYSPALHRRVAAALAAQRASRGSVRLLVRPATVAGSSRRQGSLRFVPARLPAKRPG